MVSVIFRLTLKRCAQAFLDQAIGIAEVSVVARVSVSHEGPRGHALRSSSEVCWHFPEEENLRSADYLFILSESFEKDEISALSLTQNCTYQPT